jgi:hypothetical protein
MDNGNGFIEVTKATLLTSPAVISNLNVTSGLHLNFRYRAHNVHGWSDYSDTFVIVAATKPNPPTNPLSVSTMINTKITFNWLSPVNTGGVAVQIDQYRIQV